MKRGRRHSRIVCHKSHSLGGMSESRVHMNSRRDGRTIRMEDPRLPKVCRESAQRILSFTQKRTDGTSGKIHTVYIVSSCLHLRNVARLKGASGASFDIGSPVFSHLRKREGTAYSQKTGVWPRVPCFHILRQFQQFTAMVDEQFEGIFVEEEMVEDIPDWGCVVGTVLIDKKSKQKNVTS